MARVVPTNSTRIGCHVMLFEATSQSLQRNGGRLKSSVQLACVCVRVCVLVCVTNTETEYNSFCKEVRFSVNSTIVTYCCKISQLL